MNRRMIVVLGAVLVLVAAAGVWWRYAEQAGADGQALRASGIIEATEVAVSSEIGGRLAERPVREGDRVGRGTVLARFDTELVDHQIQLADTASKLHMEQQRDRQTLRAPIDGWIARTVFEPGEIVAPGAPVAVMADWRDLTLKVYLPEDKFGRLTVGQGARVSVDAYPGETFAASVSAIASTAEFTPRNVQTVEDRVKSVFAIKLRVPNADLRLKPGMFADATFAAAGAPIAAR